MAKVTVEIRLATEADAAILSDLNAEVQQLHHEAIPWRFKAPSPDQFSPEVIRRCLDNSNARILIANLDDQPVGYAYYEIIRQAETASTHAYSSVYVHQISVKAVCQKHGVGRALMDAVQEAGLAMGITHVALDFWTFNEPARKFYDRLGFVSYNERWWKR